MGKVLERPARQSEGHDRAELEDRYRQLCDLWPKSQVEIINDRIVVSPLPTWAHETIIENLVDLLLADIKEQGWRRSHNISLFLGAQRDRYKPNLTVVPPDPPLWGEDHIHGDATVLVVEVVSNSSADDDHTNKPKTNAAAGVPLCPGDRSVREDRTVAVEAERANRAV